MKDYGLRNGEKYYLVDNYTMKCRLYPNNKQKEIINNIIKGVHVFHNMAVYDMFKNHRNTTECVDKETGKVIHFPCLKTMAETKYINELREKHPLISLVPAGALSGNNGIVRNDITKMLLSQSSTKNFKPIEHSESRYYCKKKPRTSYTYQETLSKITQKENKNVLYIDLNKVGLVKMRGINKRIRFGKEYKELIDYIRDDKKRQITITISKDNCDDYWICFKFSSSLDKKTNKRKGVVVYLTANEETDRENGVDVGIKDIAILSDGTKYENKRFKKTEKNRIRALSRRLARRQGYANIKFREERKKDDTLVPSKRYLEVQKKLSKLHRKISMRRENYNNEITKNIVNNSSFIGVESLNVKGMMRNRHLSNALSDVGLYDILNKLEYKSGWYNRTIKAIGMWTPSSQLCSNCGYRYKGIKLSVRNWTCPKCGCNHDRDINAAKNILNYAKAA